MLNKLYKNNVDNVNINLLISLEKEYYDGENLKLIMSDLKKFIDGKKIVRNINNKVYEFKINKLSLLMHDSLNEYMFYYRHCVDYFKKKNVDREELIPDSVKEEFKKIAYIDGKEEGADWFRHNIDAINLLSEQKVLTKDFVLNDEVTTIFEETENIPKVETIRYDYWWNHPDYEESKQSFMNVVNDPDCSIIDNCFAYEADYFYRRLDNRGETPEFKDFFVRQSKKYLIDETIASLITTDNVLTLYYYGRAPSHYTIFDSKKAKNNPKIQYALQNTKVKNIQLFHYVSLREKENN